MSLLSTYRLRKWRKTNSMIQAIEDCKNHPVFKGARTDVFIPKLAPENLVILLGQVHTVWKGKIGNRERNQIVRCQARLCSFYAYFEQFLGIKKFGGEGIYEGLDTSFHDTRNFQLYQELETRMQIDHPVPLEKISIEAEKILHELGKEWHRELLSQDDLKKIQHFAGAVSGQSLFSYLRDGQILMYPIEGERAYQKVLEGITSLGQQIEQEEQSVEIKAVRARGGKAQSEEEVEKVKKLNDLIKEFNQVIGSDIRERATLEILAQKVHSEPIVVFTMGVGHRKNYLSLLKKSFGDSSTAFLFITPPELLVNWWLAIGIPMLILSSLVALNFFINT